MPPRCAALSKHPGQPVAQERAANPGRRGDPGAHQGGQSRQDGLVQLDDGTAKHDVSLFSEAYEANRHKLREDALLIVGGCALHGRAAALVTRAVSLGDAGNPGPALRPA